MNRIYQKFPIIAESSGFLIRDKRAKHDIKSSYIDEMINEISKMPTIVIFFCFLIFILPLQFAFSTSYYLFDLLPQILRTNFQTEFVCESDDVSFLK